MNSAIIKFAVLHKKRRCELIDMLCHSSGSAVYGEHRAGSTRSNPIIPDCFMTNRNKQLERAVTGSSKEHTLNNGTGLVGGGMFPFFFKCQHSAVHLKKQHFSNCTFY